MLCAHCFDAGADADAERPWERDVALALFSGSEQATSDPVTEVRKSRSTGNDDALVALPG